METKVIFSPQLAQYLLHKGYIIVDLKRKHNTYNNTVFVFKVEEGFFDCIREWLGEK